MAVAEEDDAAAAEEADEEEAEEEAEEGYISAMMALCANGAEVMRLKLLSPHFSSMFSSRSWSNVEGVSKGTVANKLHSDNRDAEDTEAGKVDWGSSTLLWKARARTWFSSSQFTMNPCELVRCAQR
jgi:hypothetical protein